VTVLARSRALRISGEEVATTPLLVPSYSSRAIPPVALQDTITETLGLIAGPVLISAYDVFHEKHSNGFRLDESLASSELPFLILDSGGYEALWNFRATQAGLLSAADSRPWTTEHHDTVLKGWPANLPLLAVTYDNASEESIDLQAQIERARAMMARWACYGVEFLLKPAEGEFLSMRSIRRFVPDISSFDAVGVTEKECGSSMAERLRFIRELRLALDDAKPDVPLHIFGALDPYMTPLYFLAGADIFDGLTWLRYGFHSGRSLYEQGFVARELPHEPIDDALWEMRHRNYVAMTDLQIGLRRFLTSGSCEFLGPQGEQIIANYTACIPQTGGAD
jgi:hypothetical protein